MHPSTEAILQWFTYEHLPEGAAQDVSERCALLAKRAAKDLKDTPHGAELTTGLRKLLEAKDCFVRAALP